MQIVIGSGIIGLFIGYKLLKEGQNVTILDVNNSINSSTNAAVGMLAPLIEAKPGESQLFSLMLKSKEIWNELTYDEEFSLEVDLKKNSSILIAENSDDLERIKLKRKFFAQLGFKTQLLDNHNTHKLEPNLNSHLVGSLFCEDQNSVDPIKLKNFLKKKIATLGGTIQYLNAFDEIFFSNQKLTIQNVILEAENIIIACGAWTSKLIKNSFDLELPTIPLKGVSFILDGGKRLFNNNIWFKNIYVSQRKSNIIAVGATEEDRGFENSVSLDEIYYLSKNIWESFIDIENLKLVGIKSGIRPGTRDGYPIIGRLDQISNNVLCAFGHYRHGILLAPITAEIIYNKIVNKKKLTEEKFFSPERFKFSI
tara:strand:+ start:1101 stop:2201 length:1101 start_codon:yes stop_codon:yes gene_type:complete